MVYPRWDKVFIISLNSVEGFQSFRAQMTDIFSGFILTISSDTSVWNICHINIHYESSDKETKFTLIVQPNTMVVKTRPDKPQELSVR